MRKQSLFIQKILSFILLSFALAAPAFGQKQNNKGADLVSEEQLAKKAEALFTQWDKKDAPGCAVAAIKEGRIVYKRGFGMANLDYDVPNTPTTVFNLASVSKQFTAASVALLARQGKLSLDDDIRKYLPVIPNYGDTITIRHLIHHTSGIRDYPQLVSLSGGKSEDSITDKEILKILGRQKRLNFKPGDKFLYTNSGYILLAIIVERVSGKTLRAFADEQIFKPLGMKNTQFYDNRHEIVKNRANGYIPVSDRKIGVGASLFDRVGDQGLLSTVDDLYLWNQNFYDPKVGDRDFIELLTTTGKLRSGEKLDYAFGLVRSNYKGLPVIEHSGAIRRGFRAHIYRFPEQKFTALALCNSIAIAPLTIVRQLANIYLDGQFTATNPPPGERKNAADAFDEVKLSENELTRYEGIYADLDTGRSFTLSVKEGKLIYKSSQKFETALKPVADNRFLLTGIKDKVELVSAFNKNNKNPSLLSLKLIEAGERPIDFKPVKPPVSTPQNLSEYVGVYHSDELKTDYQISLRDNNLTVHIGDFEGAALSNPFADFFARTAGSLTDPILDLNITFTRNKKNKISEFVLNSERVKGIIFKKQ